MKHKITTQLGTGATIKFVDAVNQFEYKVRLSERIEFTKDGYIFCRDAVVGNIGELYYSEKELGWSNNNTKVKVVREESEVFDENSLESLEGMPVTILHPKIDVNSTNFKDLGHGTVLTKPRRVGDNMVVDIVIHSDELVDLIAPEVEDKETGEIKRVLNDSFRDLSLGYSATLVKVAHDLYKQTNIVYNHVAVVPEGRQINARIRDMLNPELVNKEVKPKMAIMEKLFKKGKKVVRDEKGVIITDEDVEVLFDEVEEPKSKENDKKEKEEVKDEKDPKESKETKDEKETKKEENETMVKDKKYFVDALKEAMTLPDGVIKTATIDELNKEFKDAFPESVKEKNAFQDAKAVNSEVLKQKFEDLNPTPKTPSMELDFDKVAQIKANYYRKLTDPFMHKDWTAFNDHFKSEKIKGRSTSTLQ